MALPALTTGQWRRVRPLSGWRCSILTPFPPRTGLAALRQATQDQPRYALFGCRLLDAANPERLDGVAMATTPADWPGGAGMAKRQRPASTE